MENGIDYDVIVGGGSVSGLLAAREIASKGHSILVLEEHDEIGLPEKCDGLVSNRAMSSLGIVAKTKMVQNVIKGTILHSPAGKEIEIDASKMGVIVLNRAEFDKEIARIAEERGVILEVSRGVMGVSKNNGHMVINTNHGDLSCKYFVDAMGCSSLMKQRRSEILQAAKYVIHGDWFRREMVELYFDQTATPGFFTWVIPIDDETAKVGVAGRGINSFKVLDAFVKKMKGSIVKKIAAPISIGGPIDRFIDDHVIHVGDAAGQTKPTTAGGIYSGGVGGILAGQSISLALEKEDDIHLKNYENAWRSLFGKEFTLTLRGRKIFEKFENVHFEELLNQLASSKDVLSVLSSESDFDFHSMALLKALGMRGIMGMVKTVASAELTNIISSLNAKSE